MPAACSGSLAGLPQHSRFVCLLACCKTLCTVPCLTSSLMTCEFLPGPGGLQQVHRCYAGLCRACTHRIARQLTVTTPAVTAGGASAPPRRLLLCSSAQRSWPSLASWMDPTVPQAHTSSCSSGVHALAQSQGNSSTASQPVPALASPSYSHPLIHGRPPSQEL